MLGLTISNLCSAEAVQQSLPFDRRSTADLDRALDEVRDRHGSGAIGRAALLGRDGGARVPMLPDPVAPG
jgi:DNA polymerase-4